MQKHLGSLGQKGTKNSTEQTRFVRIRGLYHHMCAFHVCVSRVRFMCAINQLM
jgi:hypothetical protein